MFQICKFRYLLPSLSVAVSSQSELACTVYHIVHISSSAQFVKNAQIVLRNCQISTCHSHSQIQVLRNMAYTVHRTRMSRRYLIPFFLEYRYCLPLSDICPGRHVQSNIMMMFCCFFVTTSH